MRPMMKSSRNGNGAKRAAADSNAQTQTLRGMTRGAELAVLGSAGASALVFSTCACVHEEHAER